MKSFTELGILLSEQIHVRKEEHPYCICKQCNLNFTSDSIQY